MADSITFTTVETITLPPESRTRTRIMFHTSSAPELRLPCIAELQPIPPAQTNNLDIVPTVNRLSTKGHTEVMIANNQATPITIKAGSAVATANVKDISWINKEETTLEEITITHADDQEELNSVEQTVDSTEHKSKLLSDSAILNTCLLYTSPSPRD